MMLAVDFMLIDGRKRVKADFQVSVRTLVEGDAINQD